MKANIIYLEKSQRKSIEIEAADLETIKTAANQWRVKELKLNQRNIEIIDIQTFVSKQEIVSKIFNTLTREKFATWYKGEFENFITGNYDFSFIPPDRFEKELKEKIEKLFNL